MAKWYANGTQNNAYIEWEKPYIQQKRQSFGCLFLFCFAIFIEIPVDNFNLDCETSSQSRLKTR